MKRYKNPKLVIIECNGKDGEERFKRGIELLVELLLRDFSKKNLLTSSKNGCKVHNVGKTKDDSKIF